MQASISLVVAPLSNIMEWHSASSGLKSDVVRHESSVSVLSKRASSSDIYHPLTNGLILVKGRSQVLTEPCYQQLLRLAKSRSQSAAGHRRASRIRKSAITNRTSARMWEAHSTMLRSHSSLRRLLWRLASRYHNRLTFKAREGDLKQGIGSLSLR